jgi:single-strand DNA-binding protein
MVNKVILLGNAGKDAEIRYLDNNVAVATFSLATSETYTNKSGEKVTHTEWHNIVVWRGLAEIAGKYIKKGKQMYLEGRIRSRSYDDKDGNKKYITEILADNIQLLGGPKDNADSASKDYPKNESANETIQEPDMPDEADDLPF